VTADRPSRVCRGALVAASAWSAALLVAGFLVPVYSSQGVSADGEVSDGSATLVGQNGLGVVVILAIPLVVSLAVWAVLRTPTRRGAVPIAWTLTGVLAGLNLLALLSIGVFVLPVTVALVVACATSRRGVPPA
jgi:hypothetical protein